MPPGQLSVTHYKRLHYHLFQDVYSWAGKFRTVRISKKDSMFCYPENISGEMNILFDKLRQEKHLKSLELKIFAHKAAHFLAELNAIHPFREGNGRTQLAFLTILASQAGHIAVGTLISERPPHRSGRAQFRHPAPVDGV